MKKLILLAFALFTVNLWAQESKAVTPLPKKISIKYDASGNRIERTDGNIAVVVDPGGPSNPNGGDPGGGQEFLTFRGNQETVKIYPNPTAALVCVDIPPSDEDLPGELVLYNQQGQLIQRIKVVSGSNHTLDLYDQPNGTYFLRLKLGALNISKTIIKS